MAKGFKDYLAEAKATVQEISIDEAEAMLNDDGVAFVDLREPTEIKATGKIPGAEVSPRGLLEFAVDPESPMHKPVFSSGKTLVFYCGSGGRSLLAGKTAHEMGVKSVLSMTGGMGAWQKAGKPTAPGD